MNTVIKSVFIIQLVRDRPGIWSVEIYCFFVFLQQVRVTPTLKHSLGLMEQESDLQMK
jgi:hypothetical protein